MVGNKSKRDVLFREVKDRLSKAQRVVALTGAGISAESGVPTFRGADGLWKSYNATDLATPEAFSRNPKLVWEFYLWRRRLIASCSPNPAHYALVTLEERIPEFTLITQNVDGLHRKAGSRNVIEIHGNLWRTVCVECGNGFLDTRTEMEIPPRCERCGGMLRPGVVWFGESLDPLLMSQSIDALENTEVLLIIGTSGVVQPVASFGSIAKARGAYVVEINLEETPQSHLYSAVILGKAGEVLPELVNFDYGGC